MLTLDRSTYEAIIEHARRDHPDEACGVVVGPAGTERAERFVPMANAERSPTFYRFDSKEQFELYRDLERRGEEVVVIYHSHTSTAAYPSRTDVLYAAEPTAHYVLVSTADPHEAPMRSFRIRNGQVDEEELRVVPALHPADR